MMIDNGPPSSELLSVETSSINMLEAGATQENMTEETTKKPKKMKKKASKKKSKKKEKEKKKDDDDATTKKNKHGTATDKAVMDAKDSNTNDGTIVLDYEGQHSTTNDATGDEKNGGGETRDDTEEEAAYKLYIGRVPKNFTNEIVQRILVDTLRRDVSGSNNSDSDNNEEQDPHSSTSSGTATIVDSVELIYPHDEEENPNAAEKKPKHHHPKDVSIIDEDTLKEHRGFGYVTFTTTQFRNTALALQTIKGGRKRTSKRVQTMYLRPYVPQQKTDDDEEGTATNAEEARPPMTTSGRDLCHLWELHRCPYGEQCKFQHVGAGGCLGIDESKLTSEALKLLQRKRKGKCFIYKKKGRCDKGDACPYSHDFDVPSLMPTTEVTTSTTTDDAIDANTTANTTVTTKQKRILANSEKDCINWKTKGRCKRRETCEYKHDPVLQQKALHKIETKKKKQQQKRKQAEDGDAKNNNSSNKKQKLDDSTDRKIKQPLSVRVFGMNYETTENDIKEFMEQKAGHPIKSMIFPKYEDSQRSKGYCGIYFASPKAARDAVTHCDNAELHGRWLRVQTGKSMTVEEWDTVHQSKIQ